MPKCKVTLNVYKTTLSLPLSPLYVPRLPFPRRLPFSSMASGTLIRTVYTYMCSTPSLSYLLPPLDCSLVLDCLAGWSRIPAHVSDAWGAVSRKKSFFLRKRLGYYGG